ncbi:hypothetical protein FRC11_003443, partial [Ceratobasidium sp. 423]
MIVHVFGALAFNDKGKGVAPPSNSVVPKTAYPYILLQEFLLENMEYGTKRRREETEQERMAL